MIQSIKNNEIYSRIINLTEAFKEEKNYLPAKVNFYISKNKQTLQEFFDIIEKTRADIIKHYGTMKENEDIYTFEPEELKKVNKELSDLLEIKHEINILMLKLSDLEGLNFTPQQMEALLFMIEED